MLCHLEQLTRGLEMYSYEVIFEKTDSCEPYETYVESEYVVANDIKEVWEIVQKQIHVRCELIAIVRRNPIVAVLGKE